VSELTAAQRVWCFRARNLASDLIVAPYAPERMGDCEARLRHLLAFAPETSRVPRVLSDHGIRLVIIQPLSDSKIDGAAMWLNESSPVIVLSIRMDRIDSFWFTLFHELSHIKHVDALSIDSRLRGEDATFSAEKPAFERRADEDAAGAMIPEERLNSFIRRVAPLYSKDRIIQFAHTIKVHPGIIVGQLQHRGEIKFSANREMLVKVRQRIASVAVTDGWGTVQS
jgi:HTH-type transcriptional regulator/antitoxin HigA